MRRFEQYVTLFYLICKIHVAKTRRFYVVTNIFKHLDIVKRVWFYCPVFPGNNFFVRFEMKSHSHTRKSRQKE